MHGVVDQMLCLAPLLGKTFPPFFWTSALMNKFTDLLEVFSLDFFLSDFPLDPRGIFLLNLRNCRRHVLQIFLQKHNFQK